LERRAGCRAPPPDLHACQRRKKPAPDETGMGDVLEKIEIEKLNRHLRRVFGNPSISVKPRLKLKDSAELYVGEEFLGVISKIEDEGETSYDLSMSILDIDLED
jgi:hypothetical protein